MSASISGMLHFFSGPFYSCSSLKFNFEDLYAYFVGVLDLEKNYLSSAYIVHLPKALSK